MLLSGKFGKLLKPISFEMAYTLTSQNFNFNAASVLTYCASSYNENVFYYGGP